MRKGLESRFLREAVTTLNFSHRLSLTMQVQTGKCYIARQRMMHLCVTILYMFTDIQLSCRTQ